MRNASKERINLLEIFFWGGGGIYIKFGSKFLKSLDNFRSSCNFADFSGKATTKVDIHFSSFGRQPELCLVCMLSNNRACALGERASRPAKYCKRTGPLLNKTFLMNLIHGILHVEEQ